MSPGWHNGNMDQLPLIPPNLKESPGARRKFAPQIGLQAFTFIKVLGKGSFGKVLIV